MSARYPVAAGPKHCSTEKNSVNAPRTSPQSDWGMADLTNVVIAAGTMKKHPKSSADTISTGKPPPINGIAAPIPTVAITAANGRPAGQTAIGHAQILSDSMVERPSAAQTVAISPPPKPCSRIQATMKVM